MACGTPNDLQDKLARVHHTPSASSDPTNTTTNSTSAAGTPSPACAMTKQPKMAIPDPFDGTHSNLKHFGAQCLLYMAVCSNNFPDDLSQIAFVLSLMKGGTATLWAMQMTKTISHSLTWEQFKQDLQAAFGEPNPGAAAQAKLESL
jgi:hypothetical protein